MLLMSEVEFFQLPHLLWIMFRRSAFLIWFLFLAMPGFGVTFDSLGPPGGIISQIVPDRRNPSLWFANDESIVYQSTDFGKTWKPKVREAEVILVHPLSSEVLVFSIFSSTNLWESKDGGSTFQMRSRIPIEHIQRAFWDPENPQFLFAFGIGNEFNYWDIGRSMDGGLTWQVINTLPYKIGEDIGGNLEGCKAIEYSHSDLLFAPGNSSHLYLSSHLYYECNEYDQNFLFLLMESEDHGRTWKVIENRESSFASDPLFPDRAFAFNESGINLITTDGWRKISDLNVSGIWAIPRHSNGLLAMKVTSLKQPPYSKRELVQSTDMGATWQFYSQNSHDANVLQTVDDGKSGIIAGTSAGIYYRNSNQDWNVSSNGLQLAHVQAVGASIDGKIVYATRGGFGAKFLSKSTDFGNTWQEISYKEPHPFVITSSVNVDPSDPNHVFLNLPYAASSDAAGFTLVTIDGGKNWKIVAKDKFFQAFDPVDPKIVYFTSPTGLYKSTEGGVHLKRLPVQFNSYFAPHVFVDQSNPSILFFISAAGLSRSNDGGRTKVLLTNGFQKTCADCAPLPRDIAALPQKGAFLLIMFDGRIYRTSNYGNTWQLFSRVSKISGARDRIFSGGPLGRHFYVLRNGSLFESLNGGKNWKNIRKQVAAYSNALTDPQYHPFYIATSRGIRREKISGE